MSCHVIVRSCLSLSMGSRGVAAGANPSLSQARAGYSLDKSPAHRRAHWWPSVSLPKGHFGMQLSPLSYSLWMLVISWWIMNICDCYVDMRGKYKVLITMSKWPTMTCVDDPFSQRTTQRYKQSIPVVVQQTTRTQKLHQQTHLTSSSPVFSACQVLVCKNKQWGAELRTHLYDHAQVSDVHPLCLNDLHDDPVQISQLRVRRHASAYERWHLLAGAGGSTCRGLFVFVVVMYEAEAPPPPVRLTLCSAPSRAQVQVGVGVLCGWRRGEVVVSVGSGPRGYRGDQAYRASVRRVGGRGRRSALITADGGGGQVGWLWGEREFHNKSPIMTTTGRLSQ